MHPLIQTFAETFDILPADTPRLLEECYRIRYEVLCREGRIPGFSADDYPDGLESDEYDIRSIHMLLRHRPSGRTIGTVRLVMATDADLPFPLESCPDEAFYPGMETILEQNRRQTTEISRLFIRPEFRSRRTDTGLWGDVLPAGLRDKADRRRITPLLGLFKAILMVTLHYGLRCWCALMEPRLAELLAGYGIVMHPMGETIDYHGHRRIYFASVWDVFAQVRAVKPEIWKLMTDDGKMLPATWYTDGPRQWRPVRGRILHG